MGSFFKANAQRDEAYMRAGSHDYLAQVARNNAVIAEQNAKYAEQKGQVKEGILRERSQQFIGNQRAHIAAAGIEGGMGSALRLQEDTARIGDFEGLTARNDAAREAYDWRVKGNNQTAEAQLFSWMAPQERHAGEQAYTGTMIGGIGSDVSMVFGMFA